jgi:hypothetical protein
LRELPGADIKLAKVVVSIEISWIKRNGFPELGGGKFKSPQTHEVDREISMRGCGTGVETDSLFEVRIGFFVELLRRIDQSKEFMDFEALRGRRKQLLELDSGFSKMTGIVLRDGGLEILIEFSSLRILGGPRGADEREHQSQGGERDGPWLGHRG